VEAYYSTTKRNREHLIGGGNLSPPLPPPPSAASSPAFKRQRRESVSPPQPTVLPQQNCSTAPGTRMSISATSMEAPNALSQSMDSVNTVTGEEEVGLHLTNAETCSV